MSRIGVVIPARNEAPRIAALIRAVRGRGEAAAIVVADSASVDGTGACAREAGAVVLGGATLTTRATAMNAGARWILEHHADVDALWFLHADSLPPYGWSAAIGKALRRTDVAGGAFDFAWIRAEAPWHTRPALLLVEMINRVRFRASGSFFGDQGIFVRRSAFVAMSGFPEVSLMEDVRFCRVLRRFGRLQMAPGCMITSPRRFVQHGPVRQSLIDLLLLLADEIGCSPEWLHARYNRMNATSGEDEPMTSTAAGADSV